MAKSGVCGTSRSPPGAGLALGRAELPGVCLGAQGSPVAQQEAADGGTDVHVPSFSWRDDDSWAGAGLGAEDSNKHQELCVCWKAGGALFKQRLVLTAAERLLGQAVPRAVPGPCGAWGAPGSSAPSRAGASDAAAPALVARTPTLPCASLLRGTSDALNASRDGAAAPLWARVLLLSVENPRC